MTTIAIAIKTRYQGRSLGKKSCKAMVDWFDAEIKKPLRWLSTENNKASIKIALGFHPVFSEDGTQAFVKPWGKKYIVFEKETSRKHP